MKKIEYPDDVFCIENFLSKSECQQLINESENIGYEKSKINTLNGEQLDLTIRNNDRIFFDDVNLSIRFFKLLKPFLPAKINDWKLYSLNERFRFYRYVIDQYFVWHGDGSFRRNYSEVSKLSLIIYLNHEFAGGNTDFAGFTIKPQEGMALIFPHKLLHQGSSVKNGCKYVLRTDVMYSR